MTVSMVVPVYNVEKYLRECLDSIVNQTYKDLEIILVDDGSKDLSGQICDEYALLHPNVKVIHKENAGLGMARNSGLDIAAGEYVYFMDSDDYLDNGEIERLVDGVLKNHVDVCLAGDYSVDDNKKILRREEYADCVYHGNEAKTKLLPLMLGSSPGGSAIIGMAASGQLYSMEPIRKHNIRFFSERKYVSEDMVFNIDYMQYANGACTLSGIGYYYRRNPNSLSHAYLRGRFEKHKYLYVEMKKKISSLGFGNDVVERLTKTFFIGLYCSIKQEVNHKEGGSWRQRKAEIIKICEDQITQDAIKNYPVNRMGIKQQVFLFLVKHKCIWTLKMLLREKQAF